MANSVFCNNCGAPIEGEPPIADDPAQRPPCPTCGSTSRNVNVSVATGFFTTLASVATLTRSEETLLTKAQELITKGDFSIAVVVAHMACEISAERAISQAFAAKGIGYLEESVLAFLSWWPNSESTLLASFQGVGRARGSIITKADAENSYKAASDLVAYLK